MVNTYKSQKHGIFWLNFIYIVSKYTDCNGVLLMVLNATFNNISVILERSVSLVEQTALPLENQRRFAY